MRETLGKIVGILMMSVNFDYLNSPEDFLCMAPEEVPFDVEVHGGKLLARINGVCKYSAVEA